MCFERFVCFTHFQAFFGRCHKRHKEAQTSARGEMTRTRWCYELLDIFK
jgi:hypothetical protein